MIINVTQEHIEQAYIPDNEMCPIMAAIKELGLRYKYVVGHRHFWVGNDIRTMNGSLIGINIPMPPEATKFTLDFDIGRWVEPISFELPIEPYIKEAP